MAQRQKTPAQIVAGIICAAMGAQGMSSCQLADAVGIHRNTILKDLKEPGCMPIDRMWLYFTALGVPIDEGLQAFADSFARSLVAR